MVLLSMTTAIASAVNHHSHLACGNGDTLVGPSLADPEPGKPISHSQLVAISKALREQTVVESLGAKDSSVGFHLNDLLRGCKLYRPPPEPKLDPSPEYKALMARLRVDQESVVYSRMLRSTGNASADREADDDDVTYAAADRQVTLMFNVMVSIVGCGAAIWVAARRWDTPARLALSMLGALVVGIAEVGVYMAYLRRVKEAKAEESTRSRREKKEVMDTWVIEGTEKSVLERPASVDAEPKGVRHRKGKRQ